MRKFIFVMILTLCVLLLSGCVPGDGQAGLENPANFLWGIWHGWLAPISLIISLFNKSINIYEVHNTGFWYDLGFYLAVVGGFGSLTWNRGKKKKKRYDD